jgi:hypothetical protein
VTLGIVLHLKEDKAVRRGAVAQSCHATQGPYVAPMADSPKSNPSVTAARPMDLLNILVFITCSPDFCVFNALCQVFTIASRGGVLRQLFSKNWFRMGRIICALVSWCARPGRRGNATSARQIAATVAELGSSMPLYRVFPW